MRETVFRVTRDQFGPGQLGQQVYDWIVGGASCEWRREDGPCGGLAEKSVDFDAGGKGDTVLVCNECKPLAAKQIREETLIQGRPTVIGFNGFGRA